MAHHIVEWHRSRFQERRRLEIGHHGVYLVGTDRQVFPHDLPYIHTKVSVSDAYVRHCRTAPDGWAVV